MYFSFLLSSAFLFCLSFSSSSSPILSSCLIIAFAVSHPNACICSWNKYIQYSHAQVLPGSSRILQLQFLKGHTRDKVRVKSIFEPLQPRVVHYEDCASWLPTAYHHRLPVQLPTTLMYIVFLLCQLPETNDFKQKNFSQHRPKHEDCW